jgi:putative transposase
MAGQTGHRDGRTQEKGSIMPYWRLFYHVVWTTRGREPLIGAGIERAVFGILRDAAERHNVIVHAIGGIEDHVHLALSIPPSTAIADAVGKIKGASSYQINRRFEATFKGGFGWQAEYGISSISDSHLEAVRAYINDQRRHHATSQLRPHLEPTTAAR